VSASTPSSTPVRREAADEKPVRTFRWHGHTVALEAEGGDTRFPRGKYPQHIPTGWVGMGYLKGVPAIDGDSLDVIIGPEDDDATIYVASQKHPETGEFSQFKVMWGFIDAADAEAGYLKLWPQKMFGSIDTFERGYFLKTLVDRFTVAPRREAMAAPLTGRDTQRVERLVRDWQKHHHDLRDTSYWQRRFDAVEDVLAKTRPTRPIQLFRSEPTNDPDQYRTRFTAWSPSYDGIHGFGWGDRRTVSAIFRPEHIVLDVGRFPSLDRRDLGVNEVIVRPGDYKVVPWKPGDKKPARPDAPVQGTEPELREQLFAALREVFSVRPEKMDQLRSTIDAMSAQELANNLEMVQEEKSQTRREAMAEVKAPDGQQLYVWRVEDAQGRGPHSAGAMRNVGDEYDGMQAWRMRPVPVDDFSEEDAAAGGFEFVRDGFMRDLKQTEESKNKLFGFMAKEDAETWFGPRTLEALREQGFELKRMPARRVWRSESGRQVFFEPLHARREAIREFDTEDEKLNEAFGSFPQPLQQIGRQAYAIMSKLNSVLGRAYDLISKAVPERILTDAAMSLYIFKDGEEAGVAQRIVFEPSTNKPTFAKYAFLSDFPAMFPVDPSVFSTFRQAADLVGKYKDLLITVVPFSHGLEKPSFLPDFEMMRFRTDIRSVGLGFNGNQPYVTTHIGPTVQDDALITHIQRQLGRIATHVDGTMDNVGTLYELEYKWSQLDAHVQRYSMAALGDKAVRAYHDYAARLDTALRREMDGVNRALTRWIEDRPHDEINYRTIEVLHDELSKSAFAGSTTWDGTQKLYDEAAAEIAAIVFGISTEAFLASSHAKTYEDFQKHPKITWEKLDAYRSHGSDKFYAQVLERARSRLDDFSRTDRVVIYEGVKATRNEVKKVLDNWTQTSLKEKIRAFHKALTTAHNNGFMADWIYGEERGNDSIQAMLSGLSNMEVPKAWSDEVNTLLAMPRGARREAVRVREGRDPQATMALVRSALSTDLMGNDEDWTISYVGAEALHALLGRAFRPACVTTDGVKRWFLRGPDGEVFDVLDHVSKPDYSAARGRAFTTARLSRRAREVVRRVRAAEKRRRRADGADTPGARRGGLTWHMTDQPDQVLARVRRGGQLLDMHDGDYGPGLYVSDRPEVWRTRSGARFGTIAQLDEAQRAAVADWALERVKERRGLSETERGYGLRMAEALRQGQASAGGALQAQPFSIDIAESGLVPGAPKPLAFKLAGKLVPLNEKPSIDQVRTWLNEGYVGGVVAPSMGQLGEAVVWDAAALTHVPDEPQARTAAIPGASKIAEREIGEMTREEYLEFANPRGKSHPPSAYEPRQGRRMFDYLFRDFDFVPVASTNDRYRGSFTILRRPRDGALKIVRETTDEIVGVVQGSKLTVNHPQLKATLQTLVELRTDVQVSDVLVAKYPGQIVDDREERRAFLRAKFPRILRRLRLGDRSITLAETDGADGAIWAVDFERGAVLGAAMNEWGATLIQVSPDARGLGLGSVLNEAWLKARPDYATRSGGFTPQGAAMSVKFWAARVRELLSRGHYSEAIRAGRLTREKVDQIIREAQAVKRGPQEAAGKPQPDAPAAGAASPASAAGADLIYSDGTTFVIYDSTALAGADGDPVPESAVKAYGFLRSKDDGTPFFYRIDYLPAYRERALRVALQIAKGEDRPLWVGDTASDVLAVELMAEPALARYYRIVNDELTVLGSPYPSLETDARKEKRKREAIDAYGARYAALLEAAESKDWDQAQQAEA
jgi:hypothetical protein